MPLDIRKPTGRPRPVQLENVTDFTGGLNLVDDVFKIAPNQSPELLNVDFSREGGFQVRRGTTTMVVDYKTIAGADALALTYSPESSTKWIAATGNEWLVLHEPHPSNDYFWALRESGTMVKAMAAPATAFTGPARFAQMDNYLFITRGASTNSYRLANTSGNTIAEQSMSDPAVSGYSESYASPSTTRMPLAKTVKQHLDYLWVGNVNENGTARPHRIRWSHPGQPGAWRSKDYIDVALGSDSKGITALAPFRDMLLIFKDESVHALYGYDASTFQLTLVSNVVGTISQESVAETPDGVFFWDRRGGLNFFDGQTLKYAFDPLYPAVEDQNIDTTADKVYVDWVRGRIWCTLDWNENPEGVSQNLVRRNLVFNPTVGEQGSWTMYDVDCGPITEVWDGTYITWGDGSLKLMEVDVANRYTDDLGEVIYPSSTTWPSTSLYTSAVFPIDAYLKTAWFDQAQPAVRKRWRRPDIVLTGHTDAELFIEVFHDYDTSEVKRGFYVQQQGQSSNALVWGEGTWGDNYWAKTGRYSVIDRGSNLGLSRAVQLKFNGPSDAVDWAVNGFILKYKPKRVR